MVRLEGRQWGLVALVALTPFFFAFVLAGAMPELVEPVLGTVLGGASWTLAALLGLVGAALFAGCLSTLSAASGTEASRTRRALDLTAASLVPVALCLVPALCLLLSGPVLALRLARGTEVVREAPTRSAPQRLMEGLLSQLPRLLPAVKGLQLR